MLTIHRDFGDRVNRKHARLKYVLAERGVAWFRGGNLDGGWGSPWNLRGRSSSRVKATGLAGTRKPTAAGSWGCTWRRGAFATWERRGLRPACARWSSGFARGAAHRFPEPVARERASGGQSRDLQDPRRARRACRVPGSPRAPGVHGLRLDAHLRSRAGRIRARVGRDPDPAGRVAGRVRLAGGGLGGAYDGVPNGCARPYLAEIGLVGKAPNKYQIYLGRQPRFHPAEPALPGERANRRVDGRTAPAGRPIRRRAPRRRALRRFLRPRAGGRAGSAGALEIHPAPGSLNPNDAPAAEGRGGRFVEALPCPN